ncbi:MAG: DUF1570 domain-containing protein [Phycisphaerae bacterium]|nr:DUF1570 domain-containing protein [Phycisphaerae bacterium]
MRSRTEFERTQADGRDMATMGQISSSRGRCSFPVIVSTLALFPAAAIAAGPQRNLRDDLAQFAVRHQTEHYVLGGTVSPEKYEEYGRALEYIYAEYRRGFEELLAKGGSDNLPAPPETRRATARGSGNNEREADAAEKKRFRVMILADAGQYHEFINAYFTGECEHTRGLYIPGIDVLVIRDEPNPEETYRILFHEAFHQFLHRYVPRAPIWVNEGLATYFGTARVTPKRLEFDPGRWQYAIVRDALDARQLIPLDEMMLVDKSGFYDPKPVEGQTFSRKLLYYAQAYTLVRFMLNNDAGREHLREYLRKLAAAKSQADVERITREQFNPALLERLSEAWIQSIHRG